LSPNVKSLNVNLVEIPISKIKKIKYVTWKFWLFNTKGGQFEFILDDHTKVNFYTPQANTNSLENYEKMGGKIADFIHVPFEMQ
jgi:hypothetical protein